LVAGKQPRLAEQLWFDLDWRDPKYMQEYADPTLRLDILLNMREEYAAGRLRPLTSHEAVAGFSLMMTLTDDFVGAETPTARAYQAAMKVLYAYYFEKRRKVNPAHLLAARIVVQSVEIELLLRDYHQKKRELRAIANSPVKLRNLAKGASPRLSPGSFNTFSYMLAGFTQREAAERFDREQTVLGESLNSAMAAIQKRFGAACRDDGGIPPQTTDRACYNVGIDVPGKKRLVEPKAEARLRTKAIDDSWFAEALEYWGYWGHATRFLCGLAEDYSDTKFPTAARDYSDPSGVVIVTHPQPAADWSSIIGVLPDAFPEGKLKSKLEDANSEISFLVSDANHGRDAANYLRGSHHWKSKVVSPPSPCRSVGVGQDWKAKGIPSWRGGKPTPPDYPDLIGRFSLDPMTRRWLRLTDLLNKHPDLLNRLRQRAESEPLLQDIQISGDWSATIPLPINSTPARPPVGISRLNDFCGPVTPRSRVSLTLATSPPSPIPVMSGTWERRRPGAVMANWMLSRRKCVGIIYSLHSRPWW
jgi:hypothetical protein